MSKAYKVRIAVTKTMWVTQEDINEDCSGNGLIQTLPPELDEQVAIDYTKGVLIEEMRNNPKRGTAEIISVRDTEIYDPKTKENS